MSVGIPQRRLDLGWQVILADLALILFLLALSALPAAEAESRAGPARPEIAPAQALFRPLPGGPSLAQWLAAQPRDPRAALTIFASHTPAGAHEAWARAAALAAEARASGVRVRTISSPGEEDDLHASLAYDMAAPGRAADAAGAAKPQPEG
jgi:hypothetical protein